MSAHFADRFVEKDAEAFEEIEPGGVAVKRLEIEHQVSTAEGDTPGAGLQSGVAGKLRFWHPSAVSSSNHLHHSFDEAEAFDLAATVHSAAAYFAGAFVAAVVTVVFVATAAAAFGAADTAVSVVSAASAAPVVLDAGVEAYWNLTEED